MLTTSATLTDKTSLTLNKILEMKKRLNDLPPVVVAMYFVDRHAAHSIFWVRGHEEKLSVPVASVRIYVLHSKDYNVDLPWFCAIPGVWIEYNNGEAKQYLGDE